MPVPYESTTRPVNLVVAVSLVLLYRLLVLFVHNGIGEADLGHAGFLLVFSAGGGIN